jgi:hypothetical protein
MRYGRAGDPTRLRALAIGVLATMLLVGLGSNLLFLAAVGFRLEWFGDPVAMVRAGATSAELLRWATVTDLLSYYLGTAVLAYVLWRILRPIDHAIADLSSMAALGFVIAGGIGAAALAFLGPMLMHAHAAADSGDQARIAAMFAALIEVVWRAIWQFLDGILLAAWWLGIGLLLRGVRPGLSRLSFVLAGTSIVGAACNVMGLALARDVMLGTVFSLWTAWWIWLLLLFVRRQEPFAVTWRDESRSSASARR